MKRVLHIVSLILGMWMLLLGVVACDKETMVTSATVLAKEENFVAIRVDDFVGEATLYDALVYLNEKGELEFVSEDSIYGPSLLSLNGKDNPADWSYYWGSYVPTEDFGNPSTVYTYEGKAYYYANFGMGSVKVEKGATYIWVFEKLAW